MDLTLILIGWLLNMAIIIDSDLTLINGAKIDGLFPATQNNEPLTFEQLSQGSNFFSAPPSGTYFTFANYSIAPTTQVYSPNILRAYGVYIYKTITFSSAKLELTAEGDGLRLGFYADNGSGYPGALISDLGRFIYELSGVQTINFPSNITLQPGFYWLAINVELINNTFRSIPVAGLVNILGANPAGGTNSQYTVYAISQTFGVMPPTFPSAASRINNFAMPWLMFLVV